MKRIISFLFAFSMLITIFSPTLINANTTTTVVIGVPGITDTPILIRSAIHTALVTHDIVIVTGIFEYGDFRLEITIPNNKKIDWRADYSSTDIIRILGDGEFEVSSGTIRRKSETGAAIQARGNSSIIISGGSVISESNGGGGAFGAISMVERGSSLTITAGRIENALGIAIYTFGHVKIEGGEISGTAGIYAMGSFEESSHITMSDGVIRATSGAAIYTPLNALFAQVTISGGLVTSSHEGILATICIGGMTINEISHSLVTVSGGRVENTSHTPLRGTAIRSNGNVTIEGGEVVANFGAISVFSVNTQNIVNVTGGIIRSASSNGSAIHAISSSGCRVIISGGLVTSANTEPNGGTIFASNANSRNVALVTVRDTGRVENTSSGIAVHSEGNVHIEGGEISSNDGIAIQATDSNSQVTVIGGTVTANSGKRFNITGNNAIAVEWISSRTQYTINTSVDLTVFGEGAIAYWDIEEGRHGVSFSHYDNIGFIEIAGITVGEFPCEDCGKFPCECYVCTNKCACADCECDCACKICHDSHCVECCDLHICVDCGTTCTLHICSTCNRICILHVCGMCEIICTLHVCTICDRTCELYVCAYCNRFPDNLYISEVNITGGYIELSNPTENSISTKGLYLSNDDEDLFMWQMPVFIIRPSMTIRIKTSSNNDDSFIKRMQTNFDLAVNDKLRLTDATGKVLTPQ